LFPPFKKREWHSSENKNQNCMNIARKGPTKALGRGEGAKGIYRRQRDIERESMKG
jgi:hypothetical protein